MAEKKEAPKEAQPSTDKLEGEEAAVHTSASPKVDFDPTEIREVNKKDIVKVSDDTPVEVLDPFRGHGGAFIINDDGIRVRVEDNA